MNCKCLWLECFFHKGIFKGYFTLITSVEDYNWAFGDVYFNIEFGDMLFFSSACVGGVLMSMGWCDDWGSWNFQSNVAPK